MRWAPPRTPTPSSGYRIPASLRLCAQRVRFRSDESRTLTQLIGNKDVHVILRGGTKGTNFDTVSVKKAAADVAGMKSNFLEAVMVDMSHANSAKDHNNQPIVRPLVCAPDSADEDQICADIAGQLRAGETGIMGVMIESNLEQGNQKTPNGKVGLKRGVSITDACVEWGRTGPMLKQLNDAVKARRELLQKA